MGVDFVLSPTSAWEDGDRSSQVRLWEGGEDAYLLPYFERIEQATGRMIDPYDGVILTPSHMPVCVEVLGEALHDLEKEPDQFRVVSGTVQGKEYCTTVKKEDILRTLQSLYDLFKRAEENNMYIVGDGD
jgi:hypothetical protein